MCITDPSVKMLKIRTVSSKGHASAGERHHVYYCVPYQPLFLDYRIWESPLLQAAKENNLPVIRKLLTDGACDIYQRGNLIICNKWFSVESKNLLQQVVWYVC